MSEESRSRSSRSPFVVVDSRMVRYPPAWRRQTRPPGSRRSSSPLPNYAGWIGAPLDARRIECVQIGTRPRGKEGQKERLYLSCLGPPPPFGDRLWYSIFCRCSCIVGSRRQHYGHRPSRKKEKRDRVHQGLTRVFSTLCVLRQSSCCRLILS